MIERVCLVLAALAGALVIGATAAYAIARPAGRNGSNLTKPVSDGPEDVTGNRLASTARAPQLAVFKDRD